MKPTWLEDPQQGKDGRRQSASLFTADYTINQTLHGQSHPSPKRVTIDMPPEFVSLDTIVSSSGPSEGTEDYLPTPRKQVRMSSSVPASLMSGPTLPLPNHKYEEKQPKWINQRWQDIMTFAKFVGPGFMIAVAYSKSGRRELDKLLETDYHTQLIPETMLPTLPPALLTISISSSLSC